ncbi:related to integral membrane protein [Rhynchosporium agropyri]|uniref:GDP-mannose transporter n=3 Tax=Rhynchosporium TaxID=38037 RepID=A0A1E1M6C7_RHYSE|nr:related to integral membrane protein [Rhynchosporium agropyri]CZT11449.1 related to integral membrane protein [Rhynchosporium commune]CZT44660.1 related to integral membrane protein [Rhynchosporium secalis]
MPESTQENSIPLLDVEAQKDAGDKELEVVPPILPAAPVVTAGARRKFLTWTAINMLATIGIVFTNKAIFDDPDFKLMQTSFASFHFVCTGLTLWVVSRKSIGAFVPKRAGIVEMLPLALSMCLNVVLPNLSLAFSTVTVYQLCRVLLTPMTAIINYTFYSATIPRSAALALIPVCLGVGVTSYYDTKPTSSDAVQTTSTVGIVFALSGVLASSAYTVLIGAYHKKLQMSSSQLLLNQAPISSVMLMFAVPIVDQIPVLGDVPRYRWMMILMSGGFAALINISQFFIIAGSGPVSSTVVGHLKTVSIVSIGWALSGRGLTDKSALGILMTVAGIIAYSNIMLSRSKK